MDQTMEYVLGILLIAAIAVIAYLLVKPKGPELVSASPAVPLQSMDEEGTQVRLVGHRLVRLAGGVKVGAEIPLHGTTTIGRDKGCIVHLADPEMSHQHAEILVDRDRCYITDVGSTNGTHVNNARLDANEPYALNDGDQIRLGGTTLLYRSRP